MREGSILLVHCHEVSHIRRCLNAKCVVWGCWPESLCWKFCRFLLQLISWCKLESIKLRFAKEGLKWLMLEMLASQQLALLAALERVTMITCGRVDGMGEGEREPKNKEREKERKKER